MFDLSGKVALVTGASRGLGRADCLALARAGADVVVTDVLIESDPHLQDTALKTASVLAQVMAAQDVVYAEQTAAEIREMGRRSQAFQMDVTNREQVQTVVEKAAAEFGGIDILVNNAGTLDHFGQLSEQSFDLWERDLKVNLSGAFNCTQAAWPYLREGGFGRLIYMSSVAGTLGGFGQASYSATKAGLLGLMRSAALEGARHGITSNAIVPGVIATEAFNTGSPSMRERMVLRTAMRAAGEPEDVAHAICFLASPEARYITGVALPVAGGIELFTF